MKPFAIYQRGELHYLGMHASEDDCWRVALGWPSDEEIAHAKGPRAMICLPVRVIPIHSQGTPAATQSNGGAQP